MQDLLRVIGLVILLEGIPYFVRPGGMKRLMAEIPRVPDRTLRVCGLAAMMVGLLLVYLGRH